MGNEQSEITTEKKKQANTRVINKFKHIVEKLNRSDELEEAKSILNIKIQEYNKQVSKNAPKRSKKNKRKL
jgi:predicted RND superfamily exporter protein